MAITAKVRNKQIDTGKVLHALVQGEHASGNITFQIIGEEELVEDFNSTYFYLLYTRPSDTRPNVLLLTNKQLQDDVISVTFKPTSYFTAQDGTVQIQIMATDTEGLSIDSETGTISGSVIWQTFPGAMFVHASQLTGTETIIEENVLTQYLAGMQDLNTQTEQAAAEAQQAAVDAGEDAEAAAGSATAAQNAKTDAEAARDKAQEWATKSDGKVDNIDYSSKHYASAAKASEQKASEWAEKETAVETGKYSAKHWAEQAHAEFNALDTYVDETLKPALDDYEEAKEGELDTYTATKKAELDTYEGTKETELNTYTGTKKTELDTYTGAKKSELDSYVANTNKPSLDSYTNNTLKPALLAYEQTQETALNTYTGTKKTELDSYVENTTKPSIDDYIDDEKKPEIDAYIAEQAGQFGADVTTLKGNVSALDKRVSNLEESLDVITEIEYPDATYGTGEVPPNKSKYAEVSVLRGVSRGWNNVCNPSNNNISVVGAGEINGITVTYDSTTKTYHAVGTASGLYDKSIVKDLPIQGGFKHLLYANNIPSGNTGNVQLYAYGTNVFYGIFNCGIGNANSSGVANLYLKVADGTSVDIYFKIIFRNVSLIFTEKSSEYLITDNIPSLVKLCPDLLKYDDYGTQVVFPTYSAVKSQGVNLFNPYAEQSTIFASATISNDGDTITVVGNYYCGFALSLPAGSYYVRWDNGSGDTHYIRLEFTDGSITDTINNNSRIVATKEVQKLYIYCASSTPKTSVYNNFQIASDDFTGKTTYHRYFTDTLTLPTPVTLRSAGSVADTDELNVKVNGVEKRRQTTRVGTVDLSLLTWAIVTGTLYSATLAGVKGASSSDVVGDMTCDKYIPSYSSFLSQRAGMIAVSDNEIRVNTGSSSTPSGTLNYALQNESVTLLDPIPDPFIHVEGGGTIKPVQTNEPETDSAMTGTYVNKITA